MRKSWIILGTAIAILATSLVAFAEREVGNGGFAFTNSIRLLNESKDNLQKALDVYDQRCFSKILKIKGLKHKVVLAELRRIIRTTRPSFSKTATGLNDGAEAQPLMFNYGRDAKGAYIEALHLYFVAFMTVEPSRFIEHQRTVEDLLLHEASHLFGYSEKEATHFVEALRGINVFRTDAEAEEFIRMESYATGKWEQIVRESTYSCEFINK